VVPGCGLEATNSRKNVIDIAVVSDCINDGKYRNTVNEYQLIKKYVLS
jgi:hypothetical protein